MAKLQWRYPKTYYPHAEAEQGDLRFIVSLDEDYKTAFGPECHRVLVCRISDGKPMYIVSGENGFLGFDQAQNACQKIADENYPEPDNVR